MRPDRVNGSSPRVYDELPNWLKQALISPLSLYQFYRAFLALILTASFVTHSGPAWLGFFAPGLFFGAIIAYWGFILASLVLQISQKLPETVNIELIILSDIVILSILMHASGGITNGMGLLLAISVTAGSLLMRGRLSLLFASMATVAVLTEQFTEFFFQKRQDTALFEAALLSLAFFAIALLSHSLYQNFRRSEEKARQALQALDQMANINAHIVDMIQLGILVVQNDGQIFLMNQKFREWLPPGSKAPALLSDLSPALDKHLQDFILSEKTNGQLPFQIKASSQLHSLVLQFRFPDKNNKQVILISAEAINEVENRAQQMKLASLGRLTASIAHEIRNPLSSISYASQLLHESQNMASPEERLTEIISTNTLRLNKIIENVLQLSRQKKAEPEIIKLSSWLTQLAERLLENHQLNPAQLQLNIGETDLNISADPSHLEQILSILTDNSLTHFDGPPDQLTLEFHGYSEKEMVILRVIDNGRGISEEHQRNLFEPFFTTRHAGTGLGLHLARELVQLNHGEILFSNAQPHGSIFALHFPAITLTDALQNHA